ncbi:MAG: LacI family DNA-binding transcriptional regulator [Clostridia bacterium]|nr:LacI family DNA-binding transcriptional regulator [Clostridia bacterium]
MAGVSKATVSRVINDIPEGVSEATRQRIKRILMELNYDPHIGIASTSNMRTHCLGLIVPDISNPFFSELAHEISNVAMEYNYSLLLGDTRYSIELECKCLSSFIAKRVDGIFLVPAFNEIRKDHGLPKKYHIPVVMLENSLDGMARCGVVVADNVDAIEQCCRCLIQNGSNEIAFITGPVLQGAAQERLTGYEKALKRMKIRVNPELILRGDYSVNSGYRAVLELESAGASYSAIIASNDLMAIGAMHALKELSRRVPEDVEVIGIDNIFYDQYLDPPLTTIQQPSIEMGRSATRILIDTIEGRISKPVDVRLKCKLLRRKTTR